MTREQAVEILKEFKFSCDYYKCTNSCSCDKCREALNMAIEALEQEGTLQNLTKPNKSDLIVKGAGEIKDGLYNIKDGKLFQYKANGGTVRTYLIVSADRPTGRWEMKPDPYGFFDEIPVCSECGCTTKMRETYKFCPNCGARMESEQ